MKELCKDCKHCGIPIMKIFGIVIKRYWDEAKCYHPKYVTKHINHVSGGFRFITHPYCEHVRINRRDCPDFEEKARK